jgi:hypothetical protein
MAAPPHRIDSASDLRQFVADAAQLVECETRLLGEDWRFLAEVNEAHSNRFADLGKEADEVVKSVSEVKAKCADLPSYFALVDELDSNLAILETAAVKLDQYSRALERRFAPQ